MGRLHDTLRARLHGRVRALLATRGARTRDHRTAAISAREALAGARARVASVEADLARMRADADLWSRPFAMDMTIDQAWRRHPGARHVFAAFHLPSCDTCAVRFDESLSEAAAAYGLDGDALLDALNDLLGES